MTAATAQEQDDHRAAQQAAIASRQWAGLTSGYGWLCWLEFDPQTGCNSLLGCQPDSADTQEWGLRSGNVTMPRPFAQPQPLLPSGYSVRSRVHEYGGGAYVITPGAVIFVNADDQSLYHLTLAAGGLNPFAAHQGCRYGDLYYDAAHQRILAVEEDHALDMQDEPGGQMRRPCRAMPVNRLVSFDLRDATRRVLLEGADFYAFPRVSETGDRLAWVSWNHPHQPWSETSLHEARLDVQGRVVQQRTIQPPHDKCYGQGASQQQPCYAPDGELWYLSDCAGWYNLYRECAGQSLPVLPLKAEFAAPPWQLGQCSYRFLDDRRVACLYSRHGFQRLGIYDLERQQFFPQRGRWGRLEGVATYHDRLYTLASASGEPPCLAQWQEPRRCLTARFSMAAENLDQTTATGESGACGSRLNPGVLSDQRSMGSLPVQGPRSIRYLSANDEPVHAFFYPPRTATKAQETLHDRGLPPLLVMVHGGPTSMTQPVLDPLKQFWLTRGFGVLDINYRGSCGFGRAYRQRLQGAWGLLDVEDARAGARYCIEQGWADRRRIAIRGSSAGGYTVLRALQHNEDQLFSAGACLYGISDLWHLQAQTHKFESHYLHWLIGDPQHHADRYRERSPLFDAARMQAPVIFFQGEQDRVVPANQTRLLHERLCDQGTVSVYVEYAGEGHGFRLAGNRADQLHRELVFYRQSWDMITG